MRRRKSNSLVEGFERYLISSVVQFKARFQSAWQTHRRGRKRCGRHAKVNIPFTDKCGEANSLSSPGFGAFRMAF
jgi:hypothetical protein